MRKLLLLVVIAAASSAFANNVAWTNWQSAGTNSVSGTLTVGAQTVNVTYSGNYFFAQTPSGIDYWQPNVYTSATVPNAPDTLNNGIVAIGTGGVGESINFSQAINNPILSVVSVNGPGLIFNAPFTILSDGCGYWGCGNLFETMIAPGQYLLNSNGEGHGTIMFSGNFTSIGINEQGYENWRGFTVGVEGLASPTPEPGSLVLLVSGGLGLLGLMKRRTR